MGKKRNRSSTSSSGGNSITQEPKTVKLANETESEEMSSIVMLADKLDNIQKLMNDGFSKLHEDFDSFTCELKAEMAAVKVAVNDLEKGLEFTNAEVEEIKDKVNEENGERRQLEQQVEKLQSEIKSLAKSLEQEKENLTNLEQYTRRENLIFNQIPENPREDCKTTINELLYQAGLFRAEEMKFHAVHRIGRKTAGRCRPIIARFISREDRDYVWFRKKEIKCVASEAYITQDYAREIKKERAVLIRAMVKGKHLGMTNIKVLDRYLVIGDKRFNYKNIPENLMDDSD